MDIQQILSMVDHTLLLQTSTWEQIREICDDAMQYHTASVCIPPCYVKQAHDYMKDEIPVCTVIGFPNGNCATATKVFETKHAIAEGAREIDMVINVGALRAKEYDYVLNEIKEVKAACGNFILKVIIETCLLTEEEKIKMCEIVTQSGADFIKTSTGFSTGGATFEDVELFAKHVGDNVKIKAAGGISSLEDAQKFIELGASRLGTSRIIKICKSAGK
jgi:deoxyribose-phosphate aldolase